MTPQPALTATANATTAEQRRPLAADLSALHPDIVKSHILTRLDGPALASAASCSTALQLLSSQDDHLWSALCRSTWPSTSSPCVSELISTFPGGGARGFFSQAFPIFGGDQGLVGNNHTSAPPPSRLISAVDIHHGDNLIFSKIQETETVTDWFRCSPVRVDLLDPKEVAPTPIRHPDGDESCREMIDGRLTLSWILIDPIGRRAVNLSSHNPVAVQRHWLTGEVQVQYASIVCGERGGGVQCGIVVTCGASEGGEMQVREIGLEIEDMDGTHLNGRDSLVFLQRALEGKKGTGKYRVQQGKRRYNQFLEMKRAKKERKVRIEETLDLFCLTFGLSIFVGVWCFLLSR